MNWIFKALQAHTAIGAAAVTSPHYSPKPTRKAWGTDMRERLIRRFTRACCCFILVRTCWLVRMRRRAQCAGVMRDRLLVLAPVVFNPSPEARISSSLSHRHALSLAEHLAMQALINTGMAILSVTEWGGGGARGWGGTDWWQHEKRGGGESEVRWN